MGRGGINLGMGGAFVIAQIKDNGDLRQRQRK